VETPDELRLLPHAAEAIRKLNDANINVLVVTNQRGIALKRLDDRTLGEIHDRLRALIAHESGARIDDFFYCPHQIGTCTCRKPDVGMFGQALKRWPTIDLSRSAMVGDSLIDVEAGRKLAMTSIQLGVDMPNLSVAVDYLLRSEFAP
jgi:D-glycero-D-manno-heptose 1,7-bisphosphate phosphatase